MVKKFEVYKEPFFNNTIIYPLERSIRRRIIIENTGDEKIALQINAQCPDMPRPKLFQITIGQRGMPKASWREGGLRRTVIRLEPKEVALLTFMMDEPDFWPEDVIRNKFDFLEVRSFEDLEGEYTRTARFEIFQVDDPAKKKVVDVKSVIKLVPPKKLENSTVSGCVSSEGKPLSNVEVKLRAMSAAYRLSAKTDMLGNFTLPCHSESYRLIPYTYQLEVESPGYEFFHRFIEPPEEGLLKVDVSLKKAEDRAEYDLIKTHQLGMGVYVGKVSENEKYVALGLGYWHEGEGYWSWITGRRPESLYLYLFDVEGNIVWKREMKGEVWGLVVSNSGYVIASDRGIPNYMKADWRPREVGKPGLGPGPSGGENPEIFLFDPSGKILWKKPGSHDALAISHKEDLIAIGEGQGIAIFELKTGRLVRNIYCDEHALRIRFTKDDSKLIVGGGIYHLYCYSVDGKLLWRTNIGGWPYTYGLDITPDGSYIATGGKIGDIRFLDGNGNVLWAKQGDGHVRGVSIAPDGSYMIVRCVGSIGTAKINRDGNTEWMADPSHSGSITEDSQYSLNSQYVIKLQNLNGTTLWSYRTKTCTRFSYITKNAKRIVAADDNGKAYFFKGEIKKA